MKLKRFLSVVLTLVMLTSGIAAAAADGDGVLRFEGEYFNLTLGGVPTAVTSANVMRDWDGQSNGAGMYALSNGVPEFDTEFYAPETGVYTMKFVSNAYAAEKQKGWCSQFKYTVNGTDVDGSFAKKLTDTTPGGSVTAAYEAPVALNKGINTLKFTATTAFTGEENNGKCLLYLDYVEFTPSDNVEILCEGEDYTAATGSIETRTVTEASGGKCLLAGTQQIPFTLTYNSYAPAGGNYKMNTDIFGAANAEGWFSPISVKITQNGNTLLDKIMIAKNGNYYSCPTPGGAATLVQYPQTVEKVSDLFKVDGAYPYNRYEWLDSIELEKGNFEIDVTCISYRTSSGTTADNDALFGLDAIRFVRENGSVIEEGSTSVVIEGEKPESKVSASMDSVSVANASGGAVGISGAKSMPAYVTYKSKIDIAGDYNLSLKLWNYEQAWMAPLAITVKQGDSVIIDNMAVSSTGKYDVVDSELGTGVTVNCDITASRGTSETLGDYNFINFDWLENVALEKGEIEVIVTVIGFSPNNPENAYMGIDAIKFDLKKDYSVIKIGGDEAAIIPGDTLQLIARDKYNSLIEAEEDVTGISWESSNENILSVDGNGLVTAKNPGKANVTLTVTHNGAESTAQREIIVMTETEQFVIKSVMLEGSEVVVKYTSNADLDNVNVMLIAGRFAADNAPLSEIKTVELSGNAPYMYRTVRIPLDSTDGKIRLFAWRGLEEVVPVFSATDIK